MSSARLLLSGIFALLLTIIVVAVMALNRSWGQMAKAHQDQYLEKHFATELRRGSGCPNFRHHL